MSTRAGVLARRLRLLHVAHNFLPHQVGGTEVYSYHLCRELARHHDVRMFFTEAEPQASQYEVRRGVYGGVRYYAAVHNRVFETFESTYVDERMDEVFEAVLADAQPDVVHIHHLLFHSANYISILKRRNI